MLKKTITIDHVFFFSSILLLWILFSFCSEVPDFQNYAYVFKRLNWGDNYHSMETGFWLLCKVANAIGLDVDGFRKIYGFIGLTLMASTVIRYTEKPYCVFLLYLFYPFLLDLVQIRHFFACSIIIYGIRYLEKFEPKNVVKYCLCVILAMSQHFTALAYSVFLIVYFRDPKKIIKIAIPMALIFLAFGKMISGTIFYRSVLDFKGIENAYMGGIDTRQFVLYFIFYVFLSLLCFYLWKIGRLKTVQGCVNDEDKSDFLFKLCMMSIIFIPLILIDFQLTRLFRGCVFILEIFIVKQIEQIATIDRFIFKIIVFMLFVFVAVKLFGPSSVHYMSLTKPVFFENNIWNILL